MGLEFGMCILYRASQVAVVVKNPPASAGDARDVGSISGREDPLEEGMATYSSILAWRIPWAEEASRLQAGFAKNWT